MSVVPLFREHKLVPMIHLRDFRSCSTTQPLSMQSYELEFSLTSCEMLKCFGRSGRHSCRMTSQQLVLSKTINCVKGSRAQRSWLRHSYRTSHEATTFGYLKCDPQCEGPPAPVVPQLIAVATNIRVKSVWWGRPIQCISALLFAARFFR
jgi:hypothetical protein